VDNIEQSVDEVRETVQEDITTNKSNRHDASSAFNIHHGTTLEKSISVIKDIEDEESKFEQDIDNGVIDPEKLVEEVTKSAEEGKAKDLIQLGLSNNSIIDTATAAVKHDPSSEDEAMKQFESAVDPDSGELVELANMDREEREKEVSEALKQHDDHPELSGKAVSGFGSTIYKYAFMDPDNIRESDRVVERAENTQEQIENMSEEEHAATMFHLKNQAKALDEEVEDDRFDDHVNETVF
jgi:hypothetical protein